MTFTWKHTLTMTEFVTMTKHVTNKDI